MAGLSRGTYEIYSTLPAQIAVRIGQAIVENEFAPGQKLREVDLAASFGVSRASVREALRMVEREGLVTILPQRGAQVTSLSAQEVQDIFEIRAQLIGLACHRLTQVLSPDMRSLTNQVQLSSDHAKGAFYRTAGLTSPSLADTESTFAELHARIDKTLELISDVSAQQLEGRENSEVVLKFPRGEMNFTGEGYLIGFALPNFYFHVTTAYAILRHNGLPLGKSMFMGRA